MTREEAARILKPLVKYVDLSKYEKEAVDMAIEALKERPKGRWVELPCDIGDTVYGIVRQHDNFDDRPYRIVSAIGFKLEMLNNIGKTVFLTREEAEKALADMRGEEE